MKEDWTDGYVAEVGYTHGYYNELNPVQLQLPLLLSGWQVPPVECACELGFGQGLGLNLHAAASGTRWWGTDFSPGQASYAAQTLAASGANAHIFDESFEEFCTRTDLPMLDMVGLHGIWSWVNDDNRRHIVDVIRRRLRPGGMVYISYNTWPGWSDVALARELMVRHGEALGSRGEGVLERAQKAFAFVDELAATEPLCWRNNPTAKAMLDRLRKEDAHYLVHEFFNRNWQPMLFAEAADWLAPAKLNFASAANCLALVDALQLTPPQMVLLKTLPEGGFRETVRDFMVNRRFRQDIWLKGGTRLAPSERLAALRALQLVLVCPLSRVSMQVQGAQHTASLQPERYEPLLAALQGHKAISLGELEQAMVGHGLTMIQLLEMVTVLVGKGSVALAQDAAAVAQAIPACWRLNQHLLRRARHHEEIRFLASPVTGGGVGVSRPVQLFIQGRLEGQLDAEANASFCWQIFKAEGKGLRRDGRTLETDADNLAELTNRYRAFMECEWPVLTALKVVPSLLQDGG